MVMSTQTLDQLLTEAAECYRLNLTDKAESLYIEALRINPKQAVALFNLGTLKLRRADLQGDQLVLEALKLNTLNEIDPNRAVELVVQIHLANSYKKHAQAWLRFADDNQLSFPTITELKGATDIPPHLKQFVHSSGQGKELERYHPMESSNYVYAIDIVGGCNLRCPTCPVGNQTGMPKGLMQAELFANILEKIECENPTYKPEIWLFNWSEPFLNPHLPEFIKMIRGAGLSSFISSNLNIADRIDSVIKANPNKLKVSLSSLKQEIYGITHERGDIKNVLSNLEKLAIARDQFKAQTEIWIGHHLYKNTIGEMDEIKAIADKYGFGYRPSYAIMAPLEKSYAMLQEANPATGIDSQLFFHPKTNVENIKLRRSGNMDCELRFNMTAINYDGSVSLCCGTTQNLSDEPSKKTYFLENSMEELEALKYAHSFCSTCINNNLHLTIQDQ